MGYNCEWPAIPLDFLVANDALGYRVRSSHETKTCSSGLGLIIRSEKPNGTVTELCFVSLTMMR